MMRSLFSGVSGLRNHQIRMDVIGNNISNVNTVGYKSSRVTFEQGFSQVLRGATRPSAGGAGGTNAMQVGLGMNIGSIDMQFTQGNLESTGVATDLAISGDSFFVVSNGNGNSYTRSGNFQLDGSGRLVASTNGYVVQGRLATDGVLGTAIQDITLPFGQKAPAKATSLVTMAGNLDASAAVGDTRETTITVYDAMGAADEVTITFTKATTTTWDYAITPRDGAVASGDTGTITFDAAGRLAAPVPAVPFVYTPTSGAAAVSVDVNWGNAGEIGGLSQFAAPSTAVIREQDGYTMGDLERFSIDSAGIISGAFSNGVIQTLGQVALASFNNPAGLAMGSDNMFMLSPNAGSPILGFSGEGSRSTLVSGALEMSNVDLAQEFTSMITAQRGFQSNARVITTSDEMLQEVVQLKR